MTTPPGNAGTWSRRRWVYTTAIVAFSQLAAVALLVRPVPPTPPRNTFATRVHYAANPTASPASNALPPVRFTAIYPALFALPSLEGFSSSAWLRYPPLNHPVTDHSEPPQSLRLRPSALGEQFFQYLASNTLAASLLVDEPLPPVSRYESAFPSDPSPPSSQLRIEGKLADRQLATPFDLPSFPHSEILSNTVIRTAVDAAGFTFSSVIVGRSGLAAADELAARLVNQVRFLPLASATAASAATVTARARQNEGELTWGTLVFLWQTAAVPPTNGVLAPSAP